MKALLALAAVAGGFLLGGCEQQSSPGFLLNGSFAGRWKVDPAYAGRLGDRLAERDRLELVVTEDIAFRSWTQHPSSFTWGPEQLGRGVVRWPGMEFPCSYEIDPGDMAFHARSEGSGSTGSSGFILWMDAERCWLPIVGGISNRQHDLLLITFEDLEKPVLFIRETT